ncbi:MAG: transglycosylase SLT domain-containing protein [Aquificota bacterium]|nr:transglycosylase SLT domain-containing protein [Aquificota bacterium]
MIEVLPVPPQTFREHMKKDVKALAREFEAVLLKEVLKDAFRPFLREKAFSQRVYYDMFLEAVSRKLAEGGGIGVADYVLRSLKGREAYKSEGGPNRPLGNMVLDLVRKHNLPSWVAYIPAVESGYNPEAVSPKGAVGLWQLMPETARRFGLRVDDEVDERFDPLKSTLAALRYIRYLLDRFGSWELVLIAYNWGEGNAERFRGLNVWENLDKLPGETRSYLLRFRDIIGI